MKQIIILSWRNLFRNMRRTSASLLTVALGAAGLLIYQGFNAGIMNQYRENTIHVRYGYGQVFPKGYHEKVLEKPWTAWVENREEIEKKLLTIPNVKNIFPRLSFYSFLIKGGVTLGGKGEGVMPDRENKFFTSMNFEDGHDLQNPGQIILGQGLAKSLNAKAGDRVTLLGQTVNGQLNGSDLEVAGVFHTGASEFDNTYFRIDLATAQSFLDTKRTELFALETSGVDAWPQVARDIRAKLPELDPIPFDDLDAVYYKNAVAFLETQFNFIRLIILFIVGLGIFNTIAVGLLERAPEVGALRANGETRSRLFRILVLENVFLGLFGGVIGITLAVVIDKTLLAHGVAMPPGPGITRQFHVMLEIQPMHYVQALLLPATTAVLASLMPVRRLLKRSIPDLLKSH